MHQKTHLLEFLDDCGARGLTPQTIATYKSNLSLFLAFLAKDPVDIRMNDLRSFLAHLRTMTYTVGRQSRTGVAASTINAYFSAISSYYDFLVWEEIGRANPVPQFRKRYLRFRQHRNGENTRQLITTHMMARLAALPGEDILARALITFGAKTGLRKGELLAMDLENLVIDDHRFTVPPRAKRTNRLGVLDWETEQVMEEYLDWREPRAHCSALWITSGGARLGKDGPYELVTRYARELDIHDPAGPLIRRFTPHCLRHWFTTHLLRSGMPREYVQELRGDSGRDAIDIYTHIDPELLRKSYLEHIPLFSRVDLQQTSLDVHILER